MLPHPNLFFSCAFHVPLSPIWNETSQVLFFLIGVISCPTHSSVVGKKLYVLGIVLLNRNIISVSNMCLGKSNLKDSRLDNISWRRLYGLCKYQSVTRRLIIFRKSSRHWCKSIGQILKRETIGLKITICRVWHLLD